MIKQTSTERGEEKLQMERACRCTQGSGSRLTKSQIC